MRRPARSRPAYARCSHCGGVTYRLTDDGRAAACRRCGSALPEAGLDVGEQEVREYLYGGVGTARHGETSR
jgi:hypothetical protein